MSKLSLGLSPAGSVANPSPREVMVYAHALCRMGVKAHGGRHSDYLREALRQAWAQLKADAAARAAKVARYEREARQAQQLDLLEQQRLELMAGRTVAYSWARGVRTGRIQGGPVEHVTEATLQWLKYAEQNVRDIAARMAEEPDPTVRVLAAHALRYLDQAGKDVDAALGAGAPGAPVPA